MRNKQGKSSAVRKLALAAALAAVCTQASALIVADGKFDGGEGYQLGMSFGILDDHGTTHFGKLYFGQDANGQYLYVQLPLGFVDNTYGANAAADWFAPLSSANGHSFSNLLVGDNLSISYKTLANPSTTNTLTMDYLADCGNAGAAPCGANSQYRSAGGGIGVSGGGGSSTGSWSDNNGGYSGAASGKPLEVATSLEYNLNNGFAGATTDSSTNAAWIKEVGYEVKFATGTFNSTDWLDKTKAPGLITLNDPTGISPSKKTFKDYTTPSCTYGCVPLPEPGTNWLLGIGALSLLWVARRRRDVTLPQALRRLMSS